MWSSHLWTEPGPQSEFQAYIARRCLKEPQTEKKEKEKRRKEGKKESSQSLVHAGIQLVIIQVKPQYALHTP